MLAVVKRFPSVAAMVAASESDWCEIDGVGKKIAAKVMDTLHGNGK